MSKTFLEQDWHLNNKTSCVTHGAFACLESCNELSPSPSSEGRQGSWRHRGTSLARESQHQRSNVDAGDAESPTTGGGITILLVTAEMHRQPKDRAGRFNERLATLQQQE